MDPITAAILVSAITAGVGLYQAHEQKQAGYKAAKDAKGREIANANALVEDGMNKRKNALGIDLSGGGTSPSGNQASQTGSVLKPLSGIDIKTNLLG